MRTSADVLAASYFHALNYRPEDPAWEGRDRFLLSIGHYAVALYAVLAEVGFLPDSELETYGTDDSRLPIRAWRRIRPAWRSQGDRTATASQ